MKLHPVQALFELNPDIWIDNQIKNISDLWLVLFVIDAYDEYGKSQISKSAAWKPALRDAALSHSLS